MRRSGAHILPGVGRSVGFWVVSVVLVMVCVSTAPGQRDINADVYLDRLRGMWFGQIMGNYAGRGYFDDNGTQRKREGAVKRGG
ncbi:MAG: hypothetical protein KAX78_01910, partial [Phycisphaerae bacterium]|nr:hypothetical protein [Phycisphaerae bacterium]